MSTTYTIDRALSDQRLLGAGLGDIASWLTWVAVLKAAFGQQLTDDEIATFATVAGDRPPPTKRVREFWAIVGRRGGKSRIAAALACYFGLFVEHRLAVGEKGLVLVLAASTDQAKVVFEYCLGFLTASPALAAEIVSTTRHEIRLRNGIVIATHSNSYRTIRGKTLCACIMDEVSFWRSEDSAMPDTETYSAVLPSLLTTNGMLVGISTGYRRTGLIYSKHRDYFGVDSDDTLVVQGSSQDFNQTLDDAAIAAQRAADPSAADSEWEGTFRTDIANFLDDALITEATDLHRPLELPPRAGVNYVAHVDAAGGTGGDAYTIAIGHKEDEELIIDVVRGTKGTYDPHVITAQYVALLKEYKIHSVTGDYYAAEWVASTWNKLGVTYNKSDLPKSAIYLEAAPLFARGLPRLPNHTKLLRELRLLERCPHRSGKDSVDHAKKETDDYANSVCGVLRMLARGGAVYSVEYVKSAAFARAWGDDLDDPNEKRRLEAEKERQRYRNELLQKFGSPVALKKREDVE